jgi:uncharacterized protein (DUF1499 family)
LGAFLLAGPERIWSLFGPADLGPVEFETLIRRTTPNDALACPPGICHAQSDVTPPVYAVTSADLRAAFAKVISSEPRITAVATDDATLTDRYIQRSALMGYPDTIVVKFFDLPEGRSTVALYSRSQLGKSTWASTARGSSAGWRSSARPRRWCSKAHAEEGSSAADQRR